MPYYRWTAVDHQGMRHQDKEFARSDDDLSALLLHRGLALLSSYRLDTWQSSVSEKSKRDFIKHLAVLLSAHIRLHQALIIAAGAIHDKYFKMVVRDIGHLVEEGVPFAQALERHAPLFDSTTLCLIEAGQETGKLAQALENLSDYVSVRDELSSKMRAAALAPLVTIGFFCAIGLGIFLWVVPRFESFFISIKEPLPSMTRAVLATSRFLRSSYIWYGVGIVLLMVIFLVRFGSSTTGKRLKQKIMLSVPGIFQFSKTLYTMRLLQVLSLLMQAGVPVLQSLIIAQHSLKKSIVDEYLQELIDRTSEGYSLSVAVHENYFFANDELEAFIQVGESSGDMGSMLKRVSDMYQSRVVGFLNRVTVFIQPLLLIVTGLLVAMLIFAIYAPIFTLSNMVG